MRIKLLVSRAGLDFSQNPGEVVDVGDAEAIRMIAAGQAVMADAAPVPRRRGKRETAAKPAAKAEAAVK
ncbi:MAG: hypothetical protein ACJA1L_003595 [Paracoccaceae bacterium]|jgi:hypothetical protein